MLIFFPGCTATYKMPEIVESTIKILKKTGTKFEVLGADEWCCGSVMLRTGNVKVAKDLAKHNVEALTKKGATKILTSCAGCYRTLKLDYPKLIGDMKFEVVTLPEFLDDLVKNGKLKLSTDKLRVTYHDPCHIGRHMGIFNPPRDVLKSIKGVDLVEMARNREQARCCGAGGGVRAGFKDVSMSIASKRVKDAEAVKADILTTSCPFCTLNLREAATLMGSKVKVLDMSEFIANVMK